LHIDVAQYLARKITFKAFKQRSESHGATGKKYEQMLQALQNPIAHRLSTALIEYLHGGDVQDIASKHNVEASEIRFVHAHLKKI
jgi:hypothetical protein